MAARTEHQKKVAQDWRLKNPEQIKETVERYRPIHCAKNRQYRIERRFGITVEEYENILKWKGKCEVCNLTNKLCLDHCHVTGRIRGVLCRKCNTGLGMLNDDPELVKALLVYIQRP